ncbi:MAG: hypothetical protein A2580_08665 [Hydrogenophilales bacterium RIFOXYD1_FULL_62_11]|nr:MAG: hypothetical protein A2580_08665 [Hydrogenophilales bacterium RIFOXYD1_FULL_62_11]
MNKFIVPAFIALLSASFSLLAQSPPLPEKGATGTPASPPVVATPAVDPVQAALAAANSGSGEPIPATVSNKIKPLMLAPSEMDFQEREADLVREIRLLELQERAFDLRKKMAGAPVADSVNTAPPPPMAAASVIDVPPQPPLRVIAVWGEGGNLNADVLHRGARSSVRAGDVVGGWLVQGVKREAISIRKGGKSVIVQVGI